MTRKRTEKQTARDRERYQNDPEYREKIKAYRKAYYQTNAEKIKARAAQHRKDNPGAVWRAEIKRRYGLTLEAWHALVLDQLGRCAICADQLSERICVDHDHETGAVRGLLCQGCNTGIGHLKDSISNLINAARYLNRHKRLALLTESA